MAKNKIGEVTHYFGKIGVAVFKLKKALKVGTKVRIKGNKTDFEQTISSIQIDGKSVDNASSNDDIGVKVDEKVRDGDEVLVAQE